MVKLTYKISLLSVTALFLLALWWAKPQPPQEQAINPKSFHIQTYRIQKDSYPEVFRSYGSLVALDETTLKSPVPSSILQLNVQPGDRVQKNDRLAELDLTPLSLDIENILLEIKSYPTKKSTTSNNLHK